MGQYKAPRDKLICCLNACKVVADILSTAAQAEKEEKEEKEEESPVERVEPLTRHDDDHDEYDQDRGGEDERGDGTPVATTTTTTTTRVGTTSGSTTTKSGSSSSTSRVVGAGADDMIPMLAYVVIMASPPRLFAHLSFVSRFRATARLSHGEAAYYFNTINAVASFVETLSADQLSMEKDLFLAAMAQAGLAFAAKEDRKDPSVVASLFGSSSNPGARPGSGPDRGTPSPEVSHAPSAWPFPTPDPPRAPPPQEGFRPGQGLTDVTVLSGTSLDDTMFATEEWPGQSGVIGVGVDVGQGVSGDLIDLNTPKKTKDHHHRDDNSTTNTTTIQKNTHSPTVILPGPKVVEARQSALACLTGWATRGWAEGERRVRRVTITGLDPDPDPDPDPTAFRYPYVKYAYRAGEMPVGEIAGLLAAYRELAVRLEATQAGLEIDLAAASGAGEDDAVGGETHGERRWGKEEEEKEEGEGVPSDDDGKKGNHDGSEGEGGWEEKGQRGGERGRRKSKKKGRR